MNCENELLDELYEIAFWHLDEYIGSPFYRGYLTWLSSRSHLREHDERARALFVRFYMLNEMGLGVKSKAGQIKQRKLPLH
jgi:hypothetical protein